MNQFEWIRGQTFWEVDFLTADHFLPTWRCRHHNLDSNFQFYRQGLSWNFCQSLESRQWAVVNLDRKSILELSASAEELDVTRVEGQVRDSHTEPDIPSLKWCSVNYFTKLFSPPPLPPSLEPCFHRASQRSLPLIMFAWCIGSGGSP